MPHIKREQRDAVRALQASAAIRARGGNATEAALAHIDAAFGNAAVINAFKLRAERLFRLSPQHPALRARFGARAAMLSGRSLDASIGIVERWWREERKAFQIACALGYGSRLSLEILRELRLLLRLMRFNRMEAEFNAVVAALCDESTHAIAAE